MDRSIALAHIVSVDVTSSRVLRVQFTDGAIVRLDPAILPDAPLTSPLRDPAYLAQVRILPNGRGLEWPNGFDLDPDWLRWHLPLSA